MTPDRSLMAALITKCGCGALAQAVMKLLLCILHILTLTLAPTCRPFLGPGPAGLLQLPTLHRHCDEAGGEP